MAKRVDIYSSKNLADLDWKPGEIVGVHNRSLSPLYDFVLMEAIDFTPEKPFMQDYDIPFLGVSFSPHNENTELWRIGFSGRAFLIRKPETDARGNMKPNYARASKLKNTYPYDAETVLAGKDEILNYFREPQSKINGLDFYADCIEDGRLQLERSGFRIFAEILDPSHTSDRFRFRNRLLARVLK